MPENAEKTVEYVVKADFVAFRDEVLKILSPLRKDPDPDPDADPKRKKVKKDADPDADADSDPKRKMRKDPDPDSGVDQSAYKGGQPANQGETAGSDKGATAPSKDSIDTTKAVTEVLKENRELKSEIASIHKALGLTKAAGADALGSGSSMTKDGGRPSEVDRVLGEAQHRWELTKSQVINATG